MARFLRVVEALGNALPHPVTLFALFSIGIVLLSGLLGSFGVAVADPRPEGAAGRAPNGLIEVVSLMNADGFRRIVLNLVTNFTSFVPLGTVLVALLGVGAHAAKTVHGPGVGELRALQTLHEMTAAHLPLFLHLPVHLVEGRESAVDLLGPGAGAAHSHRAECWQCPFPGAAGSRLAHSRGGCI